MKAIIYAGIGLFSAAAVYGITDFYNSQKKGTLNKLYQDDEVKQVVKNVEATATVNFIKKIEPAVPDQKTVSPVIMTTKKEKAISKKIRMDDFSRGRIEDAYPVVLIKEEPAKKEEITTPEQISAARAEPAVMAIESERKLSLGMFSRGKIKSPVKQTKKSFTKNLK